MNSLWDVTAAQRAFLLGPDKEDKRGGRKSARIYSMAELETMTTASLKAGLIKADPD